MTDIIERVEKALEGVTDGPWYVQHKAGTDHLFMGGRSQMANETYYPWVPENLRDWEFIAAARTLLPEAIEEIKRLEAKLAVAVEALEVVAEDPYQFDQRVRVFKRMARAILAEIKG